MASLLTNQQQFFSDICDEIRLFFPVKRIENAGEVQSDVFCVRADINEQDEKWVAECYLLINGERVVFKTRSIDVISENDLEIKKHKKRLIKNTVYDALKAYTGKTPPWGSLTGIRPTKLARDLENIVPDAYEYLKNEFDVSDKKANIARIINNTQRPYIDDVAKNDIDIYIGIPFCKTRCYYCSFISREYGRNIKLKNEYLDCLKKEIKESAEIIKDKNIRCVYIGGGTPTALSEEEFEDLLCTVDETFPMRREYTVEAGRPDTISDEKLLSMKNHNVTRISVNAQTTCNDTLKLIGRDYDSSLYFEIFKKARDFGFDNINSDIIFGLPGEDFDVMSKTLEDVIALDPENITIHTLAIKNSSYLADMEDIVYPESDCVSQAVSHAFDRLSACGYLPYYMYRQKYMSGNLENTGYSKAGRICVYNIDNMEETVSVLALGAGAISKRIFASENRIERACNVKDVVNYCDRTNEMLDRKKALFVDTF